MISGGRNIPRGLSIIVDDEFIFITYFSTVVPFNSCVLVEWDDGGKIGNKNKLILIGVFPSVHET